jgi:hypothetical protein
VCAVQPNLTYLNKPNHNASDQFLCWGYSTTSSMPKVQGCILYHYGRRNEDWIQVAWLVRLGHEVFQAERGMQINSNSGDWRKTCIGCEMNHILE